MLKYGWFQDSIWDLINSQWEIFKEIPYVLVTSIDSSENLRTTKTAKEIVESENCCSFLGNSLLVSDSRIIEIAQRYNLFSHFDEIWLYENPPTIDRPKDIYIYNTST